MGLANEAGYPHQGTLTFEDNKVDTGTGTILMRGVFPNPKTPAGTRLLSPGLFARVRLPVGRPHRAILVSDRALGTDQGKKFLYVVAGKVVQRRYVQLGGLHGGLREIKEEGLPANQKVAPDEKVVVSGLQRIRPGIEVKPLDVKKPAGGPATTPPAQLAPRAGAGERGGVSPPVKGTTPAG
jgi:multidrug efflux pump subunit AcrA (membrane-fusion protein)